MKVREDIMTKTLCTQFYYKLFDTKDHNLIDWCTSVCMDCKELMMDVVIEQVNDTLTHLLLLFFIHLLLMHMIHIIYSIMYHVQNIK